MVIIIKLRLPENIIFAFEQTDQPRTDFYGLVARKNLWPSSTVSFVTSKPCSSVSYFQTLQAVPLNCCLVDLLYSKQSNNSRVTVVVLPCEFSNNGFANRLHLSEDKVLKRKLPKSQYTLERICFPSFISQGSGSTGYKIHEDVEDAENAVTQFAQTYDLKSSNSFPCFP